VVKLNGFPGKPEVWKDKETDQYYVVYFVPDSKPPIPGMWKINRKQLQAAFGEDKDIVTDRRFANLEQIHQTGAIERGNHKEIVNTGEDPWIAWENTVTAQAVVRPYLLDDEVRALLWEGVLENREIADAEFEQTQWWQTHTAGERAWLVLSVADPLTAQQALESNRIAVRDTLAAFGVHGAPDSVIDFINNRFTTGTWTETQWKDQARALADPSAGITVDAGLAAVVAGLEDPLDTTMGLEGKVKDLTTRWLGPAFGSWSADQISKWAGRLRNDADGEETLTRYLQQQRKAMFPGYDEALTYQEVAEPWRNFWSNQWGQIADETDPLFVEIVNRNDMTASARRMREEGLSRGIGKVRSEVEGQLARNFGQVREALR